MKHLFLTLLVLLVSLPVWAKDPLRSVEGIVVKVVDGDTIVLKDEFGSKLRLRFYGIDAPETEKRIKRSGLVSKPGQPYGEEAFRALSAKVSGRRVKADIMAVDRYKRLVAIVFQAESNVNREMVAEGWAWAYRQYLDRPHASEYIDAEESARKRHLGLWQQSNPQLPWEFRKMTRIR